MLLNAVQCTLLVVEETMTSASWSMALTSAILHFGSTDQKPASAKQTVVLRILFLVYCSKWWISMLATGSSQRLLVVCLPMVSFSRMMKLYCSGMPSLAMLKNLNAFWYSEIQGADLSGMVRDHSLLCKVERQMVVGNVAFFSIDRLCSGDADSILVSGINGFANTPSQGLKFGNTVSLTYNPGYLGLQIRAHATHILTGFHYNNVGTSV